MKIRKSNVIMSVSVVLLAVACKVFQFSFLPKKYFLDSGHILSVMNGSQLTDKSYSFTAAFFRAINIFNLNDIYSWSVFLTFIFTLVLSLYFLLSKRRFSPLQYVFIFASLTLLNLFAFNLSKEIIQLLIFFVAFIIVGTNRIKRDWLKIALCSALFIFESLFFRVYYLILAALIPIIYISVNKLKDKKTSPYKVIISAMIAFFVITFFAGLISSDGLNSILEARSSVNEQRIAMGDKNAVTMIHEVFGKNKNFFIFCLNFCLDFIRLLLPIELLFKGVIYIPFLIYQAALVTLLFRNMKCFRILDEKRVLAISIIIGFLMVSAIFEPDFGSFIRHQSCIFPLASLLWFSDNEINKQKRSK